MSETDKFFQIVNSFASRMGRAVASVTHLGEDFSTLEVANLDVANGDDYSFTRITFFPKHGRVKYASKMMSLEELEALLTVEAL